MFTKVDQTEEGRVSSMAHHSNGLKTGRLVELEVFRGLLNEKVHDEYCHGMGTVGMRLP